MPKHQTSQRNPFNDNPDNSDYVERFRLFNIREGQDPEEAGINAFQEMDHYIKNGIDPAGPANARESIINERNSGQLANEMQQGARLDEQKALEERQNYNAYATTRADGLSFGDYMNQQYAAKQAQQAQQQAQQLARDKAMGRMYGESILGNGMNELRDMRLADDLQGFQPPTIKLQGK